MHTPVCTHLYAYTCMHTPVCTRVYTQLAHGLPTERALLAHCTALPQSVWCMCMQFNSNITTKRKTDSSQHKFKQLWEKLDGSYDVCGTRSDLKYDYKQHCIDWHLPASLVTTAVSDSVSVSLAY